MIEAIAFIFFIIIAVLWFPYVIRTTKFGAPFVPMEPLVVERIVKLAKVKKGDVFYDLGSGDGRLVIAAALRGAKAYGIEIDRLRVLYSRAWIRVLRLSKNAKIIQKNFFEVDFADADVVCLFLLQKTNQKLKDKFEKELKPGTRIISYAFDFEGWKPTRVDFNEGSTFGPIYLYEKPKPQTSVKQG